MANLDKLLRKIEKNKETENQTTTYSLVIGGETYEVSTMTRKEKQEFVYAQGGGSGNTTAGDIAKLMKPYIYKALNLKELAVKAKDEGYISSYYDVVDALFEPTEVLQISNFIMEINNINEDIAKEEIEDIKK